MVPSSGALVSFDDGEGHGFLSAGWNHGPVEGFLFAVPFRSMSFAAGDQIIPFVLLTDIFNSSTYFLGRGVSLSETARSGDFLLFAGGSSTRLGVPFLTAAAPKELSAAAFFRRLLSHDVR